MFYEALIITLLLIGVVLLSVPFGKYMANVFSGKKSMSDFLAAPEKFIWKITGIDAEKGMSWKENLIALLLLNMLWLIMAVLILSLQGMLPLNPDGIKSMPFDLAVNTAVSFLVNCNLQHYSGEVSLSYFSQIFVIMFMQFVSAATGMAICLTVYDLMKKDASAKPNFYRYFTQGITRVLLPLSVIAAIFLMLNGTPMTLKGADKITTFENKEVAVPHGPMAGVVAIKQLGTNGGGYMGTNSSHPFENPNTYTNIAETAMIIFLPSAMIFCFGYLTQRKKTAYMIITIMVLGTVLFLIPSVMAETGGNHALEKFGTEYAEGNLEGKELRIGPSMSAFWAVVTTSTSNGSVNSMMNSMMPVTVFSATMLMMINSFLGGVGVGFLNFYIFIILTVFIAGLMTGRTPEFLGKKIESREIKIAVLVTLLHPLLILAGTGIAVYLLQTYNINWVNNSGFRGFSEILYEFTSAAANNGSGLEGLADNNVFWNYSTAITMFLGRFLPIIGAVAIAGYLSEKKSVPDSPGTLKTDDTTFGIILAGVIIIVAALSFFPVLSLGPIAEIFQAGVK